MESWRMLRFLRNQSDLPWLCVGDFNEVLHVDEQMGGNDREEWCMEGFWEVVDFCGFTDLGFRGLPYTWDNRREGSRNIKVRLDRGLADNDWIDLFGNSTITHVQTTESDHYACIRASGREVDVANLSVMKICGNATIYTTTRWLRRGMVDAVIWMMLLEA